MCIGNTTSPAATNTTNVSWGDAWERPEVIPPGPQAAMPKVQDMGKPKNDKLKIKPKAQSSKTSGGTY